jgi:hypothetical protein
MNSVAEPKNLLAVPASGENFYAALAPPRLHTNPTFLKQEKVAIRLGQFFLLISF